MSDFRVFLDKRALDIWEAIDKIDLDTQYKWSIGPSAQAKLAQLLELELPLQKKGESSMSLNRRIRDRVRQALHSRSTTQQQAAALYKWIVGDWGGIRNGLGTVAGWADATAGWHGNYDDRVLFAFADLQGNKRISSFTKVFAYANPDEHAIYDSRVAVCLNLAMHKLQVHWRFYMPASRNAQIVRARNALGSGFHGSYREYLLWAKRVREATGISLHDIEATLFAVAPGMADQFNSYRHAR